MGAIKGSVSIVLTAIGHHSGSRPGLASGCCVATGLAVYPALVTAAANWAKVTPDRASTVAFSVARLTEAFSTPGILSNAFSTRPTQEAQLMPSI